MSMLLETSLYSLGLRATVLRTLLAGVLASSAMPTLIAAQQTPMTIPWIMRGPELYGREPQRVRLTPNGEWIYFQWLPPGSDWQAPLKPYRVKALPGSVPEVVTTAHMDSVGPLLEDGTLSPDKTRRVVSYDADLFLIDLKRSTARRLTLTTNEERNPAFSSDGRRVFFVRDGANIMALDLDTPRIEQLTDIRPSPAPTTPPKLESQRSQLEEHQRELFDAVRDQWARDSIAKAEREANDAKHPKTLYLLANERVTQLSVSPNGRALLMATSIQNQATRQVAVPNYVTKSGYTEDIMGRTKVGDSQSAGRVAFMSLPSGNVRWLHPIPNDTTQPPSITALLGWNDAGTAGLVFAEQRDYKARYIERVDADSGRLTTIDVLRDSAWVGGPCYPCGGWLPGGARAWYVSEADGRVMADVFSTANRPPELFVGPARAGATMAQLTTSPTAEWLAQPWIVPEIVRIRASDGIEVPTRIYRPQDMKGTPNGAAVIFVHGAGYLHNVHNYWSSYSREYMFNQFLASKGYVVLDMDYRASAGYGRDWRTAIYRWMGGRHLQDEVDGSRWLQKAMGIPGDRIGIYGGSYGGFMTLMALFNAPKDFGAGAALRSVTDWAHYNHGYTARILNQPQQDSIAYRRSSPIFFAQNLEDPLLMAHGMVDTNVNFQDIVRLTERFIELGKTGWDLAVFPVEDHGFVRPSSWADEYRRIFELFETHLVANGKTRAGGDR
ncbi:MAG: prolyl oligopeptidase family serine peptidase [Gemmatimonadaceae bacterium]